jgi:amino acid transporter
MSQEQKPTSTAGKHALEGKSLLRRLPLIAFFAWVVLGADGLSSSGYGPEEVFLALRGHPYLGVIAALMAVVTIFVITAGYSRIIEFFPTGGGGYAVASKLLSPTAGMISGSALIIDYILTIAVSAAAGADALCSFLPPEWLHYKLTFAVSGILLLAALNMRGVKAFALLSAFVFLLFAVTHAVGIGYAVAVHARNFPDAMASAATDVQRSHGELGLMGMIALVLHAYIMGAGTYTGIEAVSNGLPVLREPKVQTGVRAMRSMAVSLAIVVLGLMITYALYRIAPQAGKTLNAALIETVAQNWGGTGRVFIIVTLLSEAALLFVAVQTGFLNGPRVLSHMALDRWLPTKFAMPSDRVVTRNAVMLMGGSALAATILTGGSVKYLVVLYSVAVFITMSLSHLGLVRHWLRARATERYGKKNLIVSGSGLALTSFLLVSVTVIQFREGGWIALLLIGGMVGIALFTRRHYRNVFRLLSRLDELVKAAEPSGPQPAGVSDKELNVEYDPRGKTAVLLVNGFNGLGLHTLFSVMRLFGSAFRNFVFIQVGVIDADTLRGSEDVARKEAEVRKDLDRYVNYMARHGYYAAGYTSFGTDVVDEVDRITPEILERFPNAVLFGGQLVFPKTSFLSNVFHNYTIFAVQRRFYSKGIPVVVLPIRV